MNRQFIDRIIGVLSVLQEEHIKLNDLEQARILEEYIMGLQQGNMGTLMMVLEGFDHIRKEKAKHDNRMR